MAKTYDAIDLFWSFRGDLSIDHDGDVADTELDPLRSIVQEVRTRVRSDPGDWMLYPEVGAGVSDFVGQPNDKINAEQLKSRIIAALARHSLVQTSDLKIQYMPIGRENLLLRLSLQVMPTPENYASESLTIHLLYSYSDNNAYFVHV